MNTPAKEQSTRRKFAAKYRYRKTGVWLLIIGLLFLLGSLGGGDEIILSLLIGVTGTVLGIYFLRGQGEHPKVTERRLAAEQHQAAVVKHSIDQAVWNLQQNSQGALGLIAYRNFEATLQHYYPHDFENQKYHILSQINFDINKIVSPLIGVIYTSDAQALEVFEDWLIIGQHGYDVDETTYAEIHESRNYETAQTTVMLTFASRRWSFSVPIDQANVSDARRIIAQFHAFSRTLQSRGASVSDIQSLVDQILANTGKSPAEKLEQLDDLRYKRLLSDQEFADSKKRILNI